jgi:hypothetical protein
MISEDLDKKIIFKSGNVCYSYYPSFHTRKILKGLNCSINFENIEYVNFEGSNSVAEFDVYLFVELKSNFWKNIIYSIFGQRYVFRRLIGTKINLPVDTETDVNDNSIYLNYGHTPVDVLFIELMLRIFD